MLIKVCGNLAGILGLLFFLGLLFSGMPCACAATDVEAGKAQFLKSCGVCHTTDPGAAPRQGPNLHTVFGRKAGSLAGYNYSPGLAALGTAWTEDSLDRWIEDPKALVPGTNMAYQQADPEKRKLVIEYLKSLQP